MKQKRKIQKRLPTGEIIFKIIKDSIESTPVTSEWIGAASYKATLAIDKFIRNNFRRRVKATVEPKTVSCVCIRCFKVTEVKKNGLMKCGNCGSWAVKPEGL